MSFSFPLLAVALLIQAQDAPADAPPAADPPQRVRNVILYGESKCPPPVGDEVVVCAKSEESPYRIPKQFRHPPREDLAGSSWARRAEIINEVSRRDLPGSCSPIGINGQTGCTMAMLRQWAAERTAARHKAARETIDPEE